MIILTGNDLETGDVVWWTGSGWSRRVADAAFVEPGEGPEQAAGIMHREMTSRAVNGAYEVDAEDGEQGPVPSHIKERMRAAGPSVRPDLGVQAEG
ncbi:hypothetical protein B5C34_08510 [Pacificimonas flava]|uniref:DUF2849 domain-containing protein n=2 Tax=Pacificimonas TaxID=1960290 RepID=A0A219B5W0_9SPHN|nr:MULTISPECIES: DUF2849 domain-containing protein [Pacificimonas]MBZ6379295.1 DUF2849 domain-containing protein [Pacificimonas aurantium]OWV33496.1 hypothetical protein B5C34_08510 [Pacificimonas flava]